jgi:hypothetical protein
MIFLLEYDRQRGEVVSLRSFEEGDRSSAQEARLSLELRLNRSRVDREVVLLEAGSERALRKTHRRYFEKLIDLTDAPPN